MRKNTRNSSIRLSGRIFLYLLGVAFFSVISLGFFWIQNRISSHKKEVLLLKETFSETKRKEIKNKILELKDYIGWIQYRSSNFITQTLSKQIKALNLPVIKPQSDLLPQAYQDSIKNSHVPVYIINNKGEIIYSFNPLTETGETKFNADAIALLNQIKNARGTDGVLTHYGYRGKSDSTLLAAGYFNNELIPGFTIVSVVEPNNFKEVLQVHILDSIARLRYTENEYIYVNTMSGKALLTNGKYNKHPIDILSTGRKAWIDVLKTQRTASLYPNGVFHSYYWSKLSTAGVALKTSYVSYIPAWDWIIGTGFYEDDINAVIAARKRELNKEMKVTLFNILLYLLLSTLFCYLLVSYFSKNLGKNIVLFKVFFERAAKENTLIDKSKVNYREFIFMAEAANLMVEKRKLIENALKESESYYRYLYEQNPLPFLIYELDGLKILSVNEAFVKHYGYSKDETLKMQLVDLYPENEKQAASELPKKLKGLAYAGEWHHLKKDGTLISIEARSHGFSYNGSAARIAVINDISERKQMEETLRINESHLSAIFNTISDVLYFVSVEPGETYRFISVNEMFLKVTGLKREEIINKTVIDILPSSSHERVLGKFKESIETGKTVVWEAESDISKGRKYFMLKITPTYNEEGCCTHVVGSVHDITTIRETEKEIRQLNCILENRVMERTSQLESKNKELEAFSYSVSHDLRAPLRHVNGYLELLTKRNYQQLDDKGKHYIRSIHEASTQMGVLIDDLLNFSRTGRMEMKLDSIDMNRVMNDALAILEPELKGRIIEWNRAVLPSVFADYAMMRQVWVNLLSNAIKYTRKRDIAMIEVGWLFENGEDIFFVADNGAGFDMNYAQKLFGVFQRLHANEDFEGTGIGLANVRQVISRHKGRTWAEGKIDKGATFYFSIPKIQEI